MLNVSVATVRKCLVAVPALGTFGPMVMLMGLRDSSLFDYAIASVGALATGISIAILGAAALRFLPAAEDGESNRG